MTPMRKALQTFEDHAKASGHPGWLVAAARGHGVGSGPLPIGFEMERTDFDTLIETVLGVSYGYGHGAK